MNPNVQDDASSLSLQSLRGRALSLWLLPPAARATTNSRDAGFGEGTGTSKLQMKEVRDWLESNATAGTGSDLHAGVLSRHSPRDRSPKRNSATAYPGGSRQGVPDERCDHAELAGKCPRQIHG